MLYCGIDVAKHAHSVALLDEHGALQRPVFMIENTRTGMEHLLGVLKEWTDAVPIGMEATGHYWLSLYEFLRGADYAVTVINPLQISAYRKSGVRRVKNDRVDAVWIADFMRIANPSACSLHTPALLQLRELSRFRCWLSEQIGDGKRKLITILDRVFPEYATLFSDVFVQSSRALLRQAVSAQEFADFDLQELTAILTRTSRRRFGVTKAIEIQEQARQSIGIRFLAEAAHVELRCLLAQIDLLEEQQNEVEKAQETLMRSIPQYIRTIPGIGLSTGAAILSEIGDVSRFERVEKLIAYAGIDATVYRSGQYTASDMQMSKRGSPYLRLALWQAASMAIRYDEELKLYYQRKRAEGKAHGTALGAICRKLLVRIYVILKENRPYVPRHAAHPTAGS
jgi:transposase